MKLLHIDSSITGDQSVSRQLTSRIVERLRETSPNLAITYRDLAKHPLPHHAVPHSAVRDLAETQAALDEFLAAEVVVIVPEVREHNPDKLLAWAFSLRSAQLASHDQRPSGPDRFVNALHFCGVLN
jgi:FMN-dependent NADH-azoreductase